MQTLEKIRLSEEQVHQLDTGELVAIPATWEEFENFLAETDYRTDYHNGEIIIMGLATFIHEILVIRLGHLLTLLYTGKPYFVVGSNAGIRKEGKRGHYNGDVLVVKEKPVFQGKSRSIITNPYLIVEVLSVSTFNYDLGAKRRKYEAMDSVQEIMFVDPFDLEVIMIQRTGQPNVWTETTYRQPDDQIGVDGHSIRLGDIFANLPTEA